MYKLTIYSYYCLSTERREIDLNDLPDYEILEDMAWTTEYFQYDDETWLKVEDENGEVVAEIELCKLAHSPEYSEMYEDVDNVDMLYKNIWWKKQSFESIELPEIPDFSDFKVYITEYGRNQLVSSETGIEYKGEIISFNGIDGQGSHDEYFIIDKNEDYLECIVEDENLVIVNSLD